MPAIKAVNHSRLKPPTYFSSLKHSKTVKAKFSIYDTAIIIRFVSVLKEFEKLALFSMHNISNDNDLPTYSVGK